MMLCDMLRSLNIDFLSRPDGADALRCPGRIELLEDQRLLRRDVLYLGDAACAELLRTARAEPGAPVLLAGAAAVPVPEGAAVFCLSCSLPKLFNSVSAVLRSAPAAESEAHDLFRLCWDDILERRLTGADEIRHALSVLSCPVGSFVAVAVVSSPTEDSLFPAGQLLAELQALLPDTNMTVYRGEIVLLHSYEERRFNITLPGAETIAATLERYNAYLSLSNGTRNLSSLPILYGLARQTSVLGRQITPRETQRIFTVDEFNMYCIIDLCAQRFRELHRSDDIIYLIHPAVVHLTRYDHQHNSNLRTVLYYYLLNDRNLLKTAADTYMHRNTVINKINRILELVDIDLEDGRLCQRLMISIQFILYYEKVMHLELKL